MVTLVLDDPRGWAQAGISFEQASCEEAGVAIEVLPGDVMRLSFLEITGEALDPRIAGLYWVAGTLQEPAVIWLVEDQMDVPGRFRLQLNHEIGHHIGLSHGGDGLMSARPWRSYPTAEDIALLAMSSR